MTRMSERSNLSFWDNTGLINTSARISERKIDLIDTSTIMSESEKEGSSLSKKTDLIDTWRRMSEKNGDLINFSAMTPNPLDRFKHHSDREIVVSLLNLRYDNASGKSEVVCKISMIPGVSSASTSMDNPDNIIVTGTMNLITVWKELKKYGPVLVISRPMRSDKSDKVGGSEQLDGGKPSLDEAYVEETRSLLWNSEESGDSGTLTSGVEAAEALVGNLSATYERHGIKPMEYHFHSRAVTTYLKSASEMTGVTDCILVFSCNDDLDADETSFTEAISKELHKREVIPLKYNLSGGERLDSEMLYRSSVGIMVLLLVVSPSWIIWWQSWNIAKQKAL